MAFRRSIVAGWLFIAATLSGQTVEELRAKLAQADIDKAVMVERERNEHPTSAILIALIGALPALFAAWLTFEGNKMVKKAAELAQSRGDRATDRGEAIAAQATARGEEIAIDAKNDRQNKAL